MPKIIISADSTCDLPGDIIKKYDIKLVPIHVSFDEEMYDDGVDIRAEDIFERFYKTGELPKTAAVSIGEYYDIFKGFTDQGYDVIHISLGRAISSSYSYALKASESFERVYVVDSCSLSGGSGLVVLEAAERALSGRKSAKQIAKEAGQIAHKVQASFVLDTLKFMAAGGRCSNLVALGAGLLGLKPSIMVNNADGSMGVDKKFRGKLAGVLEEYTQHQLTRYDNIDKRRVFITHTGVSEEIVANVRVRLESFGFEEIIESCAGCTISSHAGPNVLGVLFLTK